MSGINNVPDNLIHFHWMLLKCLDIPPSQVTRSTGCFAQMSEHPHITDHQIHRMLPRCLHIPTSLTTRSTGCCPDVYTSPHHWPPDPQDVAHLSTHLHITDHQIHRMLPICLHISTSLTTRSTGCCPSVYTSPHHWPPDPQDVAHLSTHLHITDHQIHRMLPICLHISTSLTTRSTGCCPSVYTSPHHWPPDPQDVAHLSTHLHITDHQIHRMLPICLHISTSLTTRSTGCCPDVYTSPHHWPPDPQDVAQMSGHPHITRSTACCPNVWTPLHNRQPDPQDVAQMSTHHITDHQIHRMLPRCWTSPHHWPPDPQDVAQMLDIPT